MWEAWPALELISLLLEGVVVMVSAVRHGSWFMVSPEPSQSVSYYGTGAALWLCVLHIDSIRFWIDSIRFWIDSIGFRYDSISFGSILSGFASILCIRIDSINFGSILSISGRFYPFRVDS
jgi:hypothetical protein